MEDIAKEILQVVRERYQYWENKEHNSHSIESEARFSECQIIFLRIKNIISEYEYEKGCNDGMEDAFIEKAIGWIDNNNRDGGCNFCGWEKDFKNYMNENI
jgi:hypothetical protein